MGEISAPLREKARMPRSEERGGRAKMGVGCVSPQPQEASSRIFGVETLEIR